jgi:hypothetical protein
MNNQDTEKTLQFLTEKWGDKNCSMCSKGPWEVQKKFSIE